VFLAFNLLHRDGRDFRTKHCRTPELPRQRGPPHPLQDDRRLYQVLRSIANLAFPGTSLQVDPAEQAYSGRATARLPERKAA
jgi:hypothetical protein